MQIGSALLGKSFDFNRIGYGGSTAGNKKLSQPYKESTWVMRAIKFVAGPISAVPFKFTIDKRGGEQSLEDPELEAYWNAPAEGLTRYDFIEASVGWLKITGECFWILDDTWLRPFVSNPSKLILARPDKMRHIVKHGELIGWEFRDKNNTQHLLLPEQVCHIKNWNPYDEWRGLGELEAAKIAAEADYLAGNFVLNLMRNNGDQGVYVVAKSGMPSDVQREQIIAQLRQKRAMSQRGEFRPVFVTGDVSIEDPKIASPDAAFHQGRIHNRHEVFIALGVPASMADVKASYSIGSASDRFRLIEETCMPLGEKITSHIEVLAQKQTGQQVFVALDWDEHSVFQEIRAERIESATKLWQFGMPVMHINEYLRLGLPEYEGWDVGYLPFSVAPVSVVSSEPAMDPATDPNMAETEEEKSITEMMKALRTPIEKGRDPKEVARWRDHMAKRISAIRDFESKFNRELFKARSDVLKKIELFANAGKSIETKAAAADFMFDLETFREGLIGQMRKAIANSLNIAGKQLFEEIGNDDAFAFAPTEVLLYQSQRENLLRDIPDAIFEDIREEIGIGIDEGETMKELAARVRKGFNGISKARARTIAQTETSASYGYGRQEAMTKAGVKKKRWLTSGNTNVRATHAAANGQTVGIDEPFIVGGEELIHPGDPNGSPENTINCHCISIPVSEDED